MYEAILILSEYISVMLKVLEVNDDHPDPEDLTGELELGVEDPRSFQEDRFFDALHVLTKYEYFLPQYKEDFIRINDNVRAMRFYHPVDDYEYSVKLMQLEKDLNILKDVIGCELSKFFKFKITRSSW